MVPISTRVLSVVLIDSRHAVRGASLTGPLLSSRPHVPSVLPSPAQSPWTSHPGAWPSLRGQKTSFTSLSRGTCCTDLGGPSLRVCNKSISLGDGSRAWCYDLRKLGSSGPHSKPQRGGCPQLSREGLHNSQAWPWWPGHSRLGERAPDASPAR